MARKACRGIPLPEAREFPRTTCVRIYTMATDRSLAELLQQAESLRTDMQTGEELPSVHRNLHQIAEAGQRLLDKISGVQTIDESTDAKA